MKKKDDHSLLQTGWSPESATTAYLDTFKLCKHDHERRHEQCKSAEPESSEFISALAAGMRAQLIVEVSSEASQSTIALAAAARQTGGRLVCILPEPRALAESKEVIDESGLREVVEFKVGDPYELLPNYENIDFTLVDCRPESYRGLLKLLDVNPRRSVVIANNLGRGSGEGFKGCSGGGGGAKTKSLVRSMSHPIGRGMEVTMIGKKDEFGALQHRRRRRRRRPPPPPQPPPTPPRMSKWVAEVDERGEEHYFRMPL